MKKIILFSIAAIIALIIAVKVDAAEYKACVVNMTNWTIKISESPMVQDATMPGGISPVIQILGPSESDCVSSKHDTITAIAIIPGPPTTYRRNTYPLYPGQNKIWVHSAHLRH